MELENKIKRINAEITEEKLKEWEDAKVELDAIHEKITEGIILRSKVNFYEKGEKNTSYFLNQIKRNQTKSNISKLQTEKG